MDQQDSKREGRGDAGQDELRRRVEAASGGEPAAGLSAEGEGRENPEERPDSRRARESERPPADEVTEADARAQTRRVEGIQQSGEGIHGVDTGRADTRAAEEDARRAAEGESE